MKRLNVMLSVTALTITVGFAGATATQAASQLSAACGVGQYKKGNCNRVPPGHKGKVTDAPPQNGDRATVVNVPKTTTGLEVTSNQVTPPKRVKGAVQAIHISAVNGTSGKAQTRFNPPLTLSVDPKYQACAYDTATGKCTPLKTDRNGNYIITNPGTYVVVPKQSAQH